MKSESSIDLIKAGFTIAALSLAQVCVFVIAYEAVAEVYTVNFGPMNRVFGFRMQLNNGLILLCTLAGLNSTIQLLVRNQLVRLATRFVCCITWAAYWLNIGDVVPNRFLLLSSLGMA